MRFVCLANSAATGGVALPIYLEFSPWLYLFEHEAVGDPYIGSRRSSCTMPEIVEACSFHCVVTILRR
jgi:hypothetical protein